MYEVQANHTLGPMSNVPEAKRHMKGVLRNTNPCARNKVKQKLSYPFLLTKEKYSKMKYWNFPIEITYGPYIVS